VARNTNGEMGSYPFKRLVAGAARRTRHNRRQTSAKVGTPTQENDIQ
jgi:hypothetical protein